MQHNQVSLAVLVKGRPITEYSHHGQVFVEGRAASEYEIEIGNNSVYQIEAIVSVDGLSVIDGQPAGQQSRGYLVDPCKTLRIPGWTLDQQNIAKFAFAGKDKSYATQMTGDARNNGVIGLMAYMSKYAYRPQMPPLAYAASAAPFRSYSKDAARGIAASSWAGLQSLGIAPSVSTTISDASYSASTSGIMLDAMSYNAAQQNMNVVNSLGTAFGDAQAFATTKVQFSRGDMLSYLVVYYDNLNGLRARGVKIERVRKGKYKSVPEAFPAMAEGCQPPPGWKG